jgi:cytochrome d ubiquinol oxidase subunit II
MQLDLVPIWTLILGFGVFMYVLLDGFDLGVGILFPLVATDAERTLAMNSVAPVWDGNETWLVLGGVGLLAAFPLAFAVIIPAVYFPHPADAARAHLPRRRVRIPAQGDARAALVGSLLLRGVDRRDVLPGCGARHVRRRLRVSGRAFAGGSLDWCSPSRCSPASACSSDTCCWARRGWS